MNDRLKKFFTPAQIEYEYLTLDVNGLIIDLSSDGVLKFADCPENVKIGKDICSSFPEFIGLEEIFKNISQGKIAHFELQGVNRISEDSPFYFDIHIFPVQDFTRLEGDILIGFENTTQLMLQEKKYNQIAREYELTIEKLEKNKAYIEAVFESMNDLLLITDQRGVIQTVNRATQSILEYQSQELINHSLTIFFSDAQASSSFNLSEILSGEQLPERLEVNFQTKTGREMSILFSCSILSGQEYEAQELLWIGHDITERKKIEFKLHQQLEQEHLLSSITQRIRHSLNLEEILNRTVIEVRQLLQTDSVLCCQLHAEFTGTVLAKSFADDFYQSSTNLSDPVLIDQSFLPLLEKGKVVSLNASNLADIDDSFDDLLMPSKLQGQLIVPILIRQSSSQSINSMSLWGVLLACQYKQLRSWQEWEIHLLEQLATQVAFAIQQAELYEQLQRVNQELEKLAMTDGLTQVANHRFFNQKLKNEWNRLCREVAPLSLILCDIDYFKRYNDTYGHLAGDSCLQRVATALRQSVKRSSDLVARYGGEEFAIILPNTDLEGATHLAEMICTQIRSLKIPHRNSQIKPYLTLSVGVATTIPMPFLTPETLILTTDYALYQAKTNGRDCIFQVTDPLINVDNNQL